MSFPQLNSMVLYCNATWLSPYFSCNIPSHVKVVIRQRRGSSPDIPTYGWAISGEFRLIRSFCPGAKLSNLKQRYWEQSVWGPMWSPIQLNFLTCPIYICRFQARCRSGRQLLVPIHGPISSRIRDCV
ncbi:hypothetical protein XENTR_v10017057 [Xenopus tropicalis]|nr:hypothetical protein XENTR_v10017057 [Xenopus tropicalis]